MSSYNSYEAKKNIFGGWLYPLVISALVLFGSFSGLEIYTALIEIAIVSVALLVSNTIKPFLFLLLTFVYQMPKEHLYPSDYYTSGYNLYLIGGGAALLVVSLIVFVIKNDIFLRARLTKIPLFFPLCIMTLGLILNGINQPDYTIKNFIWAALMMLVYFLLYVIIYLGIKGEDPHELTNYFTYMTLLMSWILIALMAKLYFVDGVIVDDKINRGLIVLGFGVQNIIGFNTSMLIPMNFYGFMKGKTPILSLVTAFTIYITTLATTSRNAMVVGTFYFVVCLIICMLFGDRKVEARIAIPTMIVITAVAAVVFKDECSYLLDLYVDRGMDSSGRFDIWKECFEIFKENSTFGVGFFGMLAHGTGQFVPQEFIPQFAHNTVFELLSATGLVGSISYLIYRISTLKYMLRKPTLDRFMLMMGASVLIAEGLLDNYVFQIYNTFYYVVALAIAVRLYERDVCPTRSDYDYCYHLD